MDRFLIGAENIVFLLKRIAAEAGRSLYELPRSGETIPKHSPVKKTRDDYPVPMLQTGICNTNSLIRDNTSRKDRAENQGL